MSKEPEVDIIPSVPGQAGVLVAIIAITNAHFTRYRIVKIADGNSVGLHLLPTVAILLAKGMMVNCVAIA